MVICIETVLFIILVHIFWCEPAPDDKVPISESEETQQGILKPCEKSYFGAIDRYPYRRAFTGAGDEYEQTERLFHNRPFRSRSAGGKVVNISEAPFIAYYGTECAGAIMSSKWVITAAICGIHDTVLTGSSIRHTGFKHTVCVHFIHPQWQDLDNENPYEYNLQLLLLERHITFNTLTKPSRIANDPYNHIHVGNLYGWGSVNGPWLLCENELPAEEYDYEPSLQLTWIELTREYASCSNYGPLFRVSPRMFCAKPSKTHKEFYKRRGPCRGDNGSPFVSDDGRLLGLVAYDGTCQCVDRPGIFTHLVNKDIHGWITGVTGFL